ncbi:MAG: tRNA (N(6)-L-threonylcarbamoyladenosine(37)-C(2))-methylthiotransferase MtaB [Chloroflexi bacterium]|nr:tRNA (N(6)-L-threonylcarbamoyladenosine(37)-C(2))-methylthiotransferase MtaB [Chloroflexota bacterium]
MDADKSRPSVALATLGCKLNQAESELLARQLYAAGFNLVSSVAEADIYLVNTCTVTGEADRKARQMLRSAHDENPRARLVVTGCYAKRAARELDGIQGLSLVIGDGETGRLPGLLRELSGVDTPGSPRGEPGFHRRTRTFLKIQEGCRNFCTYCIVPFVRSEVSSRPIREVVEQVSRRAAEGYKEVVLTGTEVGLYEHGGSDISGLLAALLSGTSIARLRLSSLQPQEISSDLLRLWRDPRLCPHFHLSLQSGSPGVLRRMKRLYSPADYRRAVEGIRAAVPDAAITTDIIVGFPGETDAEFQESLEFCRGMGFARIHVFPYSQRPGTAAAAMGPRTTAATVKRRSRQMLELGRESTRLFMENYLGREMLVLMEGRSEGVWSGLTGNYIKVYAKSRADLANELVAVKLTGLAGDGMRGSPG